MEKTIECPNCGNYIDYVCTNECSYCGFIIQLNSDLDLEWELIAEYGGEKNNLSLLRKNSWVRSPLFRNG